MFFLYDFFQDSNAINFTSNDLSINGIQISNGIYEHMNLLNVLNISENLFDTTTPTIWNDNTLLNCNFINNINGGSISDIIANVSKIEIQRQEVGTTEWITLQTIYKVDDELQASFTMYDTYNKNNTLYEYRILPIAIDGTNGASISKQVLSQFCGAYICDANNIYNITDEYTLDSISTVQKSVVYEPYGRKYPIVAYNATTQYRQGQTSAILLAPTSKSTINSYIDKFAQVNLVSEFNSWLSNRRAKIIKDFNGNFRIVTIHSNISNDYYKVLGNAIASTTFNWVEMGEFTQEYLDQLGMTEQFELEFSE